VWLLRNKPPQCINNVDVVEEVDDELFPFIPGVSEINVQVPQNKWGATRWTGFPCRPKILHPHRVSGGNVYSHAKLLIASDKLEREEIWRDNMRQFYLVFLAILFPQQGNPPWLWLAAVDARILYPDARQG
jgi:hypothetical protein